MKLLPELNLDEHGNANRESWSKSYGKVEAYLDVLGIKVEYFGTYNDIIERIKCALAGN